MGQGKGTFEVDRRYVVRVRDDLWASLGEGWRARHRVGRWGWDRFGGGLAGPALVEIELDRPDEPIPAPPAGDGYPT